MRIGTWNLGTPRGASPQTIERRLAEQVRFMARENCDVWLLTEVPFTFEMALGDTTFSKQMNPDGTKAFAAVWAKGGLKELDSIHEAAAFATVGDLRVCSCVFPWNRVPLVEWPDEAADVAAATEMAIDRLRDGFDHGSDLLWGGDWNQTLQGRVTTVVGRKALSALISTLALKVPTAALAHTDGGGYCSIDHIAVPNNWNVTTVSRLVGKSERNTRLSDHDAYVVDVER
jgi:hypothetical protein